MTRDLIKNLVKIKRKKSGRDSTGKVSVRHRGGEHKRYLRIIDWKRDKKEIPGVIKKIEYDPNRNAEIALVVYPDGEKRYILSPVGLQVGEKIMASKKAPIKPGNSLPLVNIPTGVAIHNIEIISGRGATMVRGAGTYALILSKDEKGVLVKLPSGEIRLFSSNCWATVGQVGNQDFSSRKLGKAGDKRHLGIRPTVRGVAQHPNSHPHGGGEGKSGIGMKSPKTPWGKKARGVKTRKKRKYSDKFIVKPRKKS